MKLRHLHTMAACVCTRWLRHLSLTGMVVALSVHLSGCGIGLGGEPASRPAAAFNDQRQVEWAFTQEGHHPEQLLIDSIESAERTLDVAIYSLTHPDIVKAIKEAHQRGVAVRLITDKSQLAGKSQTEAAKILGSAGVPMKVNTHSGLMHHKMTVVDQRSITTGSFNYSKAASTRNDELLMLIHDEQIAASFAQHFDSLWNNAKKFESIDLRIAQDPAPEISEAEPDTEVGPGIDPGAGASLPQAGGADDSCDRPMIKGNISSNGEKIYHLPDGLYYERTVAEEMFCSVEAAELQGYRVSSR